MEVNTQVSNGFYTGYKTTTKVTQEESFAINAGRTDDNTSFQQCYSRSEVSETRRTEECYEKMISKGTTKVIPRNEQVEQIKPLGMGFLFVGDMGYGMSAGQVINSDTDDTIVRVKVTLGENNFKTYDVNLSEVDSSNATAIEMFALCQYADANGTGVNNTFGSWHALKSFAVPLGETLNFSSLDEAATNKMNWNKALSKSTLTLEKKSTGEKISVSDILEMLKETHKLTKENIKEKDWREMSDEQWDKMLEGIDEYIEDYKEDLKKLKELQDEAARKGAANAPADMKTLAASKAALMAAANGIVGAGEITEGAEEIEKSSWTYNLETEDQTILAVAKMANEFAPYVLSKAQELALTGDTTVGISETENIKECATLNEEDEKKKTWTITAFTEQGIICKESTDGVTKELWRIDFNNSSDYKKVWDFLGQFDKDADLKYSGEKNFWDDFLAGRINVDDIFTKYSRSNTL